MDIHEMAMEFNGILKNLKKTFMSFHDIAWNIMEYKGISGNLQKIQRILPWNSMGFDGSSMESHRVFRSPMEFPWNSKRFHELHWNFMGFLKNSMEFQRNSVGLHGIPLEFHGITWNYNEI